MTSKKRIDKAQPATGSASAAGESTRIETVTPELAAEWLKSNSRNRKLVIAAVETIANDIKHGRWRTTHQGIAFGADGELYDGQHRLHAIVKAGVAVEVRVTRGLPPEARDAIDTGNTRRAHDVLAITDGVSPDHHVRSAVLACRTMVTGGGLACARSRYTVHDLRDAIAEHGADALAVWVAFGSSASRIVKTSVLAALAIAYRTNPAKVLEFVALVRSGESMTADHPAAALRNHVLMHYVPTGAASMNDLSLRTFAAFDAYATGRTVKQLKCSTGARAKYLRPWGVAEESN